SSVIRANLLNSTDSWRVEPLRRSMADDIARTAQWFTFGLACIVLLIACANIANLQLVRVAGRSREYAIRSALGAGRRRLLRQSLAESLIISFIGGGFSVLLAYWGIEFINRRLFRDLPGARVTLDLTVLAFTLAVSMLTGLIFGMVPAWLASCVDVNQTLRDNARGSTAGRTQHRLRHSLIAGEVAFALVLLAGAGLFLRGLQRYARLDPGWRVDGLVTANVMLQGSSYETDAQRRTRYEQIEERLSMLPGVRSAAISQSQPVWGFSSSGGRAVEGQPEPESGRAPEVFSESVSLGYFETMGIPLIEGRTFTAADTPDHPPVVIINQAMARRFWPNESAIGKRIGNTGTERNWEEIVGIAGDVGFPGTLDKPYTGFQSFRPLAQAPWGGWRTIELRTARPPEALAGDLKHAIASLDSDLPVYDIRTARSLVEQGLGPFSLVSQLLGTFALLGFALAAIGIYGVTSYSVAQRTAEIGVRMALGARRRDVLWLVLAGGARLVLVGTILGLAGAYAVGRLLESAIPTLPTHDPFTLVFLTLALIAVALFACYLPARRATRVDPLVALRSE
ncbi:MAG TPA: ADOP family duplicated permease, partial [Blastocatellia bacterium]|nr:ADOP family duplicated permease [Blastocatellia bacterium]